MVNTEIYRYLQILDKKVCRMVVGTSRVATTKNPDGTFVPNRDDDEWEIGLLRNAIGIGLNWIDTARVYGDAEIIVGEAIRGLPREKVVVVTKIGKISINPDDLKRELGESCERLGTIPDIVLLHDRHEGLMGQEMAKAIGVLDQAVEEKMTSALGVSNFRPGELEDAIKSSRNGVLLYQAKANLNNSRPDLSELLKICEKNEIIFMASSALNRGNLPFVPEEGLMSEVISKYDLSVVQYGLLTLLIRGMMPIVQSHNFEHMLHNVEVFNKSLGDDVIKRMAVTG